MTGKLVTLRLDGDLKHQGFQVILEIGFEGERPQVELQGHLPPDPELASFLQQWQQSYGGLGIQSRIRPQEIVYGGSVNRLENCRQLGRKLGDRFNDWLQSASFQRLDLRLREELQRTDLIRIVLRSSHIDVRQLPWYLWDLIQRFPQAELVLSAPTFEQTGVPECCAHASRQTVRILAILGHSADIDVESDRQRLMNLPYAEVTFLAQPRRQQFNDHLWEQPWDILFFAGHSQTKGEAGRIYLNPQDSLTLEELSYGLQRAIAQGLQLAIFNSCDGLGLAQELEHLHIPQVIVMREPVPDPVAQAFLNYFLTAFASGLPLHLAVRQARERLQGLEDEFPYASWLPVLCQAPNVLSPTWDGLRGYTDPLATHEVPPRNTIALASILVIGLVWGLQTLGFLQSLELQTFDQLMRLRPAERVDDRMLVVTIDEADIEYQDVQGMARHGSLSDQALMQLLQKVNPYQPRAVGLDIFHDFEFAPELATMLNQMPAFVATCEIAATADNPHTIAAPPTTKKENLGFSDVPVDPHYVIRRQFLGMTSVTECPTSQSLSLRLAMHYLKAEAEIQLQRNTKGEIQMGRAIFPKLPYNAGGYQLPVDEAKGYQILLNYRQAEPERVSLRSILNGELDSQLLNLVRDRIILIGVTNSKDVHLTPYDRGNLADRMPGVIVHAHMISQIISAVLDQRPLLRWLPQWGELFWMSACALVGAALVQIGSSNSGLSSRSLFMIGLRLAIAIALIYGICFGLLVIGWWLPFVSAALALSIGGSSVVLMHSLNQSNSHSVYGGRRYYALSQLPPQ
ncbi:CHASE2 domain-containing protein [Leptolyngbya sp. PL-A3]|uniref:CHASE2 domain-containing protein n=1 Tax=Leptolyngbya sp. PL-A3 TaxID=2933911 RepID=UPI003298F792